MWVIKYKTSDLLPREVTEYRYYTQAEASTAAEHWTEIYNCIVATSVSFDKQCKHPDKLYYIRNIFILQKAYRSRFKEYAKDEYWYNTRFDHLYDMPQAELMNLHSKYKEAFGTVKPKHQEKAGV